MSEATGRKAIPKSIRFEVFKRDSFTCQYCGGKAPDVVLHVDHIKPVADGGGNDILNLVTACSGCNLGKSDTPLSDSSAIEKQRAQLEELNERRQQLEMLVEWRESLRSLDEDYLKLIQTELLKYSDLSANENGMRKIRAWLKRFGVAEILKAIDTSFSQYLRGGDDGRVTVESWEKAFNMVPRLVEVARRGGYDDNMKAVFYARGVLRNRLNYMRESEVLKLLKGALAAGMHPDDMIDLTKQCRSWSQFRRTVEAFIGDDEI